MYVTGFEWNEYNIEHIARHHVTPQDVEEACYLSPLILKGRSSRYYILGQSESGRYLAIVIEYKGKGMVKVITARDMDYKERKRYQEK